MSTAVPVDTDLHLPDLHIKGFRGIKDLQISRLGRVTLLAGKNGVGKTTVLEAVKVYSARGRHSSLIKMLLDREETSRVHDQETGMEVLAPRWEALFYGRVLASDSLIAIGPENGDKVSIRTYADFAAGKRFPEDVVLIQVGFREIEEPLPINFRVRPETQGTFYGHSKLPEATHCEPLGPGLPSSTQLAELWDRVALTDEESRAVDALNLIYSDSVERVAMIGDDVGPQRGMGRRAVVKLRDQFRPVPLKSLGDGAVRLFGVALALANSKDGFLLIDEAENGIHHSIQRDFWTMILKAAHQNNVQVLATTHSWDCVAGFAMAATEIEEVDGALVRLDRYDDRIRAVEYTEDDLRIAAKHGIEVR